MNRPRAEALLDPIIADVDCRRNDLRSDPTCRFVCSTEFCKMLISRSSFERSDDIEAAVLGLTNSSNGCRFLIEAEIIQKLTSRELNFLRS
jgi:hypothetical protein